MTAGARTFEPFARLSKLEIEKRKSGYSQQCNLRRSSSGISSATEIFLGEMALARSSRKNTLRSEKSECSS